MDNLLNLLRMTFGATNDAGTVDLGSLLSTINLGSVGMTVLGVLLVALLTRAVAGKVRGTVTRRLARTRADAHTVWLMGRLAFFSIWLLGILWMLGIAGVSWAALATALGIIGIAVSLSLQELLKNLVAGVYILIERPFKVGENIRIKDFEGVVESINIRTTLLRSADGQYGVVPNAAFLAEIVVNRPPGERKEVLVADGGNKEDKVTVQR